MLVLELWEADLVNRQQIRQAARKKAMEGQEGRRRERAAQDKRLEGLAVDVLAAVAERDEAIREAEHRAGVAVRSMLEGGVSASMVAEWCGDTMNPREVRRLARGVETRSETVESETGPGVAPAVDAGESATGQEHRA